MTAITAAWVRSRLPPRPAESHKGTSGHVLLVAGSRGMSGAATLATLGALRTGAGLVTTALPASERFALTAVVPEALTLLLTDSVDGQWDETSLPVLDEYIKNHRIEVVAIGPGLGVRLAVRALVLHALREWKMPLVLDADGLNNISAEDVAGREHLLITPHPGEFARFFRRAADEIQSRRQDLTKEMSAKYKMVCLLKGHQTVISDGHQLFINPTGNPAMATGGMGDVLTGIIAACLAQKLSPLEAAAVGAYLHGLSADLHAVSDRGLLASEVAHGIPRALRKIGVTPID